MTALLLDTETTGIENAEIIEMAWLAVPDDLNLDQTPVIALQRYRPSKTTTYGALAVHHILPSDLEYCISSSEATCPSIASYLIGHNIDFDWKQLGSPDIPRICTLALCRSLYPESDAHSLTAMMYYLEGMTEETRTRLKNAHNAACDIENNYLVLKHIIKKLGVTTMSALWAASEDARIPKTMTFGKHKGKRIDQVDKGYATWYSNQPDTDEYLLVAFRRAGLLSPKRN